MLRKSIKDLYEFVETGTNKPSNVYIRSNFYIRSLVDNESSFLSFSFCIDKILYLSGQFSYKERVVRATGKYHVEFDDFWKKKSL